MMKQVSGHQTSVNLAQWSWEAGNKSVEPYDDCATAW